MQKAVWSAGVLKRERCFAEYIMCSFFKLIFSEISHILSDSENERVVIFPHDLPGFFSKKHRKSQLLRVFRRDVRHF